MGGSTLDGFPLSKRHIEANRSANQNHDPRQWLELMQMREKKLERTIGNERSESILRKYAHCERCNAAGDGYENRSILNKPCAQTKERPR
jgi:hypothetical protein